MNKKFAAVLAATCVLGATTAFAANPFSDVTPNDWAYQAVAKLAAEGVINGYPDGTFKGERNITRYEMAQMVARAMAHQDQVDAEQQAQIDRLANEFANELNSLGVRVSNLENRVGNVKVTGDARVRWQDNYGNKGDDKLDMRARLQFNAKVSENTEAVARVTTGNFRIDGDGQDAGINLDQLYVKHNWNGLAITGGRYGETLGATGYWYDSNVDGVKVGYQKDAVTAMVGYGNFKDMQKLGISASYALKAQYDKLQAARDEAQEKYKKARDKRDELKAAYDADPTNEQKKAEYENYRKGEYKVAGDAKNAAEAAQKKFVKETGYNQGTHEADMHTMEATYGVLGYQGKNFDLAGTYIAPNGKNARNAGIDSIWGVGGAVKVADQFKLSGDYFSVEGKNQRKDADFWVARADFGKVDLKKPGSFNIFVDYVDAEDGSYLGGTGSLRDDYLLNNAKSWGVGAGVAVVENVKLEAFRSFNAKTQDGKDLDDFTKVQLVYKF